MLKLRPLKCLQNLKRIRSSALQDKEGIWDPVEHPSCGLLRWEGFGSPDLRSEG